MVPESRHISVRIPRSAGEVYGFVADPGNLPRWAGGVGSSVERVDGLWVATGSPLGRVTIVFAPSNEFGVLDHDVTLPSGESVHNPMRVIPDGDDAAEVVFTLRRQPGTSDEEFERDAATVASDLDVLRALLAPGATTA